MLIHILFLLSTRDDRRYPYDSAGGTAASYGSYGGAYGQDYSHPAGHAGGAGR